LKEKVILIGEKVWWRWWNTERESW